MQQTPIVRSRVASYIAGMGSQEELSVYAAAITARFPELSGARFQLLANGWHSAAVDVEDRLIFKFPRHEAAERALIGEARLLEVVRPAVTMAVPKLTLHAGPPLFSRHDRLQGDHLTSAAYDRLPENSRRRLADRLALFYAELHGLDARRMTAAGAGPIQAWLAPDDILAKALPVLPSALRDYAVETVSAWRELPPDPHGTSYGFFDGHGWNMAFDHASERLVGVYDFADSGFGPLHQEFIYSNFISADLTARIVAGYEALTGRELDRRRIALLTGAHRLSELAALADDLEHRPAMVAHVAKWAGR